MTLQDIEEIFDLKDLLEPLVARRAVERITTEAAAELMSVMEDMERASETQDLETWLAADHRYHDLLCNMAGNERLKQFEAQLNSQLYRLWAGHSAMEGQMAKSCIEHRTVAEAVVSRQPDLAAESTLKHVCSLRASLVDVMKNVLIPFLGQEL
jgi:DNA-binding GntR family transcriptional regulator